ncbi:sporulation protein YqfD [Sporosarcina koreensis]|uniref:sporulation protein YqfD n=1 Tax=Sporosarcina koreensis TaxID=334735 RepID=UPI00058B7F30|nr:sporulation protein YqfD [Sporosarcina koreensis]
MKKRLFDVELSGSSCTSFINEMVRSRRKVTRVEQQAGKVWLRTDSRGLRYIRANRRRHRLKVHIVRLEDGLPAERLFRSWSLLLFGLIPFAASLFLWQVTVDAEHPETAEKVQQALERSSVKPMQLLGGIPAEDALRTQIMAVDHDLSWVRFEKKGTTLHVIPMLSPKTARVQESDGKPSELAARTGGVVTGFRLSSGEPVAHRNQTVKKGDLLATGVLVQGDKTAVVGAEGAVFADYWLEYRFSLPRTVRYRSAGETETVIDWQAPWSDKRQNGRPWWKVVEWKEMTDYPVRAEELNEGMEESFLIPLLKHKLLSETSYEKEIKDENILQVTFDSDKVTGTVLFLINENIAEKRPISQGGDD